MMILSVYLWSFTHSPGSANPAFNRGLDFNLYRYGDLFHRDRFGLPHCGRNTKDVLLYVYRANRIHCWEICCLPLLYRPQDFRRILYQPGIWYIIIGIPYFCGKRFRPYLRVISPYTAALQFLMYLLRIVESSCIACILNDGLPSDGRSRADGDRRCFRARRSWKGTRAPVYLGISCWSGCMLLLGSDRLESGFVDFTVCI